ncbi:UNVERIFIED_CONTAM: hypothetical protein Scaly_1067800 [Sesamum calycinum]|uniref:Uncharacterized protein n=1 Tax=Sesamum calycinum TaxID=2727403 RepID=A0AAW2QKV3_9LAMI
MGKSRGLVLLWRKDLDVWIQSYLSHHIDATVQNQVGTNMWHFTGFYGHPEATKCKLSWELLRKLSTTSSKDTTQDLCLTKLTACGEELKAWDKNVFGNIRDQTRKLADRIKLLQGAEINVETRRLISTLQDKLEELYLHEEVLWQQQAKAL